MWEILIIYRTTRSLLLPGQGSRTTHQLSALLFTISSNLRFNYPILIFDYITPGKAFSLPDTEFRYFYHQAMKRCYVDVVHFSNYCSRRSPRNSSWVDTRVKDTSCYMEGLLVIILLMISRSSDSLRRLSTHFEFSLCSSDVQPTPTWRNQVGTFVTICP